MTDLVLNISRFGFQSWTFRASQVLKRVKSQSSLVEIIFLGLTLAIIQLLDGIFTGVGVSRYGVGIEANLFVRALMVKWGYVAALASIKLISLVVIAILCRLSLHVSWVPSALKGVIVLYLCAAIIPWSFILFA